MQIRADIVLQVEFRNRAGVLTNPTVVDGHIKDPAGSIVALIFSPTVKVGIWECTYVPTLVGKYWWRVEATGTGIHSAGEKSFVVEAPHVQ